MSIRFVPLMLVLGCASQPASHTVVVLGQENAFGVAPAIGHALDVAQPGDWSVFLYAKDSTTLANDWTPYGGIVFAGAMDAIRAAGVTPDALVWVQGESDASAGGDERYYGGLLSELIAVEREQLGVSPVFIGLLNAAYVGPNTALVRLGADQNAAPDVDVIDQDAYALSADGIRYDSDGYDSLGTVYASAIVVYADALANY